jgi:hypothetical protein
MRANLFWEPLEGVGPENLDFFGPTFWLAELIPQLQQNRTRGIVVYMYQSVCPFVGTEFHHPLPRMQVWLPNYDPSRKETRVVT